MPIKRLELKTKIEIMSDRVEALVGMICVLVGLAGSIAIALHNLLFHGGERLLGLAAIVSAICLFIDFWVWVGTYNQVPRKHRVKVKKRKY